MSMSLSVYASLLLYGRKVIKIENKLTDFDLTVCGKFFFKISITDISKR